MKCYNHPDVEAVGICSSCNRALCSGCAVDMHRGLACLDRCEHEVRRLLDLRDFSFAQPQQVEQVLKHSNRLSTGGGALIVALGVIILAYRIYVGVGSGYWAAFGGVIMLAGLGSILLGRRRPLTAQFRICSKCGYNVTGNTSGKCPECGYLV